MAAAEVYRGRPGTAPPHRRVRSPARDTGAPRVSMTAAIGAAGHQGGHSNQRRQSSSGLYPAARSAWGGGRRHPTRTGTDPTDRRVVRGGGGRQEQP